MLKLWWRKLKIKVLNLCLSFRILSESEIDAHLVVLCEREWEEGCTVNNKKHPSFWTLPRILNITIKYKKKRHGLFTAEDMSTFCTATTHFPYFQVVVRTRLVLFTLKSAAECQRFKRKAWKFRSERHVTRLWLIWHGSQLSTQPSVNEWAELKAPAAAQNLSDINFCLYSGPLREFSRSLSHPCRTLLRSTRLSLFSSDVCLLHQLNTMFDFYSEVSAVISFISDLALTLVCLTGSYRKSVRVLPPWLTFVCSFIFTKRNTCLERGFTDI